MSNENVTESGNRTHMKKKNSHLEKKKKKITVTSLISSLPCTCSADLEHLSVTP